MTAATVSERVDAEVAAYDPAARAASGKIGASTSEHWHSVTLADFEAARIEPTPVTVNFSGGLTQECWLVTRGGAYRVAFMPRAGYFSLVVTSDIGPLDIGVQGGAVDCFGAVQ